MPAAAARLAALPAEETSPVAIEARRVQKLLNTALIQQQAYSHSRERLHSTPRPNRSYSRHWEEPEVSSSERRRHQHMQDNPAREEMPAPDRNRPRSEAREEVRQSTPVHTATTGTGATASGFGIQCLVPALRSVKLPKDFKGPRKVPNYTADLPPEAWVESYEMAMEMLDVDESACAKYFTMMLEGTARTWLKALPPNSIGSWGELRSQFIKNFKDTCKQPMSVIDLAACVQGEQESTSAWVRRVL